MSLRRQTVVNERYTVVRTVRTTGLFSHAYLAEDAHTDEEVLLIEYFPEGLAGREEDAVEVRVPQGLRKRLFEDGLAAFLEEHIHLRKVSHPSVVEERRAFEAHGTGYKVQTYEAGASLDHVLKRRSALTEEAALAVLMPLLSGLEAIHAAGIIHGGLAPASVWLTQKGQPVLQHLRHAQLQLARDMEVLPDVVLPGYSPPEQYLPDFVAGPWVDVYAAAALLFRMLSGHDLPDAQHRLRRDEVPALVGELDVEAELQEVLLGALELDPAARTPSVAEWLGQIERIWNEHHAEPGAPEEAPEPSDEAPVTEESTAEASSVEAPDDLAATEEWEGDGEPEAEEAAVENEAVETGAPVEDIFAEDAPVEETVVENVEEEVPEDRPARRRPDRRRARRAVNPIGLAVGGALLVLVAVMFGSTLFVHGEGDAEAAYVQQALFFVAEGDTLRSEGHLEAARQLYRRALSVDPENEVAARRLVEVDEGLVRRELGTFRRLLDAGDSLMAEGMAHEAAGEMEDARRSFVSASTFFLRTLDLRPGDSLVLARVQWAAQRSMTPDDEPARLDSNAVEEPAPVDVGMMRRQMFEMLREEAEARLSQGDTVGAERKFSEAFDLRPDTALQRRLTQLRQVLGERQRQEQYEAAMEQGHRLLEQQQYTEARLAFEAAVEAKPADTAARERLQFITQRQQDERQRMRQYEYFRAEGDVLLRQGELDEALARYREAQTYASTDTALQAKIASVERRQEARLREAEDAQRRDERGVYIQPDTPPQLIGSHADLHRNAEYPETALRGGIEGRVYVQLVVDADGRVAEAEVLRGIGAGCDDEAVRVLKEAQFRPATVRGEPVKARHAMFIEFKLQDD